jgi:hypothetical protein
MKYFIDTEFIEGFHKPLFGKKRHFIDLISIGIVCEDGGSYYAISNEFDLKKVWNKYDLDYGSGDQRNLPPRKVYWLRDNVLKPIFQEWLYKGHKEANLELPDIPNGIFSYKNFEKFLKRNGKPNKKIATEIMLFVWADVWSEWNGGIDEFISRGKRNGWDTDSPIEFYGYFADYDWVLFCSLFGRMIDLPEGFPMYCRDLKQMFDEAVFKYCLQEQHLIEAAEKKLKLLPNYPKQTNEHNALSDAKWNYELYKFLKTL